MIKNPLKKQYKRVAAIQMCSSHRVDENLKMAKLLLDKAANNGATLAVLPENFAFMGLENIDRLKEQETFGHGKIQQFLTNIAKELQLWIVGGTIPVASSNPQKVYATSLLYNDQGKCVARYDKIHLFDATVSTDEEHHESAHVAAGHNIIVAETPIGKLGLAVCFDVRFPKLFLNLAKKGAELMILPSAFTVPTGEAHWEILTRCRAIDTFSYLVAPGQGGTHANGRKTYGHSLIIDPWGKIIAQKNDSEPGVIYADIDLERLKTARKAIPLHDDE